MIYAEKLVQLLAKKKVISKELSEGLLERIAQSAAPIPADVFAQRLVERGIITQAIADNILRILDEKTNISQEPKKQNRLPQPPKLPSAPTNPFTGVEPEPVTLEKIDDSLPIPAVFSSKKLKVKKGTVNPWDSKLLLYGGGGILLLLIASVLLYYAIYRRGADEFLSSANAARESGNYTEAIREYTDYLKFFPNHTSVPEATIRLSLSKMRLITDSKSDWPGTLLVAKEEIAKIVQQPDYRKEAEPEFSAMLPTIAEELARAAKEKKDEKLLADAEEAMLLIQKHVPTSSQPADRIQKAQVNIDFTKREIAKDARLAAVQTDVETSLKSGDISGAYEKMVALQIEYSGIENDSRYLGILQTISGNEKQAVKFVEEKINGKTESVPEKSQNVILFANRKVAETQATSAERTLYVYASGNVFAVRSTDGGVLWKKTVGGSLLSIDRNPAVIPLPVSADKEDVLLVDYRTWELVRLDATNGAVRFRCIIGEPFRLAEIAPNKVPTMLFLTTESGKCIQVDVETGQIAGCLQFPQRMSVAPLVDETNQRIVQTAYRTTLFLCPLAGTASAGELKQIESVYLGHLPGTVRTAPFFFGPYLLISQQTGPASTALNVYEISKTEGTGNYELKSIQSLPIRGTVDTAPIADNKRLFLASDIGTVYLFQLEDDPAAKLPLKLIAEGATSDNSNESENGKRRGGVGSSRYLGLFGQNLWVSGQELIAYEIQPSRNRLVSLRTMDQLTSTVAPLRRIENAVFRTFSYKGQSGTVLKAFALEDGKALWETQFADPLVEEPTYDSETQTIRAVTQSGKLYQFSLGDINESKTLILDKPTADLEGEKRGEPIQTLVPLAGGFEAWIEKEMVSKSISLYDSSSTNPRQFRFIPTSEKFQTSPIAFGNGILAPFTSGKVAFYDPKTSEPYCEPFVVKLAPNESTLWSAPIVASPTEFWILDRQQSVLYKVGVEKENGKYRFRILSKQEGIAPQSDTLIESGGTVYVFSTKNGTCQQVTPDQAVPGRIYEFGSAIQWGPHQIGQPPRIVLATTDQRMHVVSQNAETYEIPNIFPQGKPILKEGRIMFTSNDGTIYQIDSATNVISTISETGVPTKLGPFLIGDKLGCIGLDGGIYFEGR